MDLRNFPFDVQKCNLTIESCKFMRLSRGTSLCGLYIDMFGLKVFLAILVRNT